MVEKTIKEINEKINEGRVNVVIAEEMPDLVRELGVREATKEVDVVTTGTFGAMCSSGEMKKNILRLQKKQYYICRDPFFRITLEPYHCPKDAPEIVQRMTDAGNTMGIGPMSAVAGTIAALAVEAMVLAGATYAIVDNGGDIALINDSPVLVGIYAGNSPFKNLAFEIEPSSQLHGICTSSGTVGPSISFGNAVCNDSALCRRK